MAPLGVRRAIIFLGEAPERGDVKRLQRVVHTQTHHKFCTIQLEIVPDINYFNR